MSGVDDLRDRLADLEAEMGVDYSHLDAGDLYLRMLRDAYAEETQYPGVGEAYLARIAEMEADDADDADGEQDAAADADAAAEGERDE